MLDKIRIQHYKSLHDVSIDLSPFTVFIGPNGSGKSNICESIYFLSKLIEWVKQQPAKPAISLTSQIFSTVMKNTFNISNAQNKFWRGEQGAIKYIINIEDNAGVDFTKEIQIPSEFLPLPLERLLVENLAGVKIYDFTPTSLAQTVGTTIAMERTGLGIAYALADILLNDRDRFAELETRFTELIPNIERIVLERQPQNNQFLLYLRDKFSNYLIPSTDISDGTLRILAFLTALYEIKCPKILCFEEPENGIHPWLLHKIVEMFNLVSTKGVRGEPIQILVTTHSPALLNLLRPEQIRAVELSDEGKTRVHNLPIGKERFQKALDIYDGELGEMWFTDMFGGNPR